MSQTKKYNPGRENPPQSVSPGELLLAKIPGWPWWPVYILSDDQVGKETKSLFAKKSTPSTEHSFHYFQFLHTFEYDRVDIKNFRPFRREIWASQLENNLIKRIDLRAAVRQALDPTEFLVMQKETIGKDLAKDNNEITEEEYEAYDELMNEKLVEREELEKEIVKKTAIVLSKQQETIQKKDPAKTKHGDDGAAASVKTKTRPRRKVRQGQQTQSSEENSQPETRQQHEQQSLEDPKQQPTTILSDTRPFQEQTHTDVHEAQQTPASPPAFSGSNQLQHEQSNGLVPRNNAKELDATEETQPLKEQPQNQRHDERISEIGQEQMDHNGAKRELEEQDDMEKHQSKKMRRSTNDDKVVTQTPYDNYNTHQQEKSPSTQFESEQDQPTSKVNSPMDIAVVPGSPEAQELESVVHTPKGPECQLSESAMSNDREEETAKTIMQSRETEINNDMVQPSDPITATHENSTGTKQVIKPETSSTPSITQQVIGENKPTIVSNGTTSSEEQITSQPNFKRAIHIKYRLQKILDKHENTDVWSVKDNRLMKVVITDIQKNQLPQSIVETLQMKHWVIKCLKYKFTVGEDGFDYKTELNNILQSWQ